MRLVLSNWVSKVKLCSSSMLSWFDLYGGAVPKFVP